MLLGSGEQASFSICPAERERRPKQLERAGGARLPPQTELDSMQQHSAAAMQSLLNRLAQRVRRQGRRRRECRQLAEKTAEAAEQRARAGEAPATPGAQPEGSHGAADGFDVNALRVKLAFVLPGGKEGAGRDDENRRQVSKQWCRSHCGTPCTKCCV